MSWANAVLATDEDLSRYEARMPDLAKQVPGSSGKTAYDGKRDLAKERIGAILRARGLKLDGIQNPEVLTPAAAQLELSLIFRDMSFRDELCRLKADYYFAQFQEELELAAIDYVEPAGPEVGTTHFGLVPLRRA